MSDPEEDGHYMIFCKHGNVYTIDPALIERDHSSPIKFCSDEWAAAMQDRLHWSAAAIVHRRAICPRDIVVLTYSDDGESKCSWFVRCAFENKGLQTFVGDKFLWQLPHSACMSMMVALEEYQRNMASTNEPEHELVKFFRATSNIFEPEKYDGDLTRKQLKMTNWTQQLTLMSIYPTAQPAVYQMVQEKPEQLTLARRFKRTPQSNFLNDIADDMSDLIIDVTIKNLLESPDRKDLQSLLHLRLVSKRFKDAVDRNAVTITKQAYSRLHSSLNSMEIRQVQDTGIFLMKSGFSVANAYASWTRRQWAERDKKPVDPITFGTFLGWRRSAHKEPYFLKSSPTRQHRVCNKNRRNAMRYNQRIAT